MPAARPIKHGTHAGYYAHYRKGIPFCDACKEAEREYNKQLRAKPKFLAPDDARHGSMRGYQYFRCRCFACRDANRIAKREAMQRKRAILRGELGVDERQAQEAELARLIVEQERDMKMDIYGDGFEGGNQRPQKRGYRLVLSLDQMRVSDENLHSTVIIDTPQRYLVEWRDPTADDALYWVA